MKKVINTGKKKANKLHSIRNIDLSACRLLLLSVL